MTRKTPTELAQINSTLETARQLRESKRDHADFPRRSAFPLRDLRSVIHHLAVIGVGIGVEDEAECPHRCRIKFAASNSWATCLSGCLEIMPVSV